MNQDPYSQEEELFDEEPERRRRGLDLTSTGFRIGATLFVLALSLLLIYVAVRPDSDEEALAPVPTLASNPTSGPAQGLATFTALQRRGIESRFLYFPDENHWIAKPANSLQWHAEVLGWLDRHLRN